MNRYSWYFPLLCLLVLTEVRTNVRAQSAQSPPPSSTGVIAGHVTDESGQPLIGARLQAVGRLKKWAGPYYELPTGRPDESDDRGEFRLHSLPPGQYVVAVSVDDKRPLPEQGGTTTRFVRTYNPGTTSLADAQLIAVQARQEQRVTIRVAPMRFMSVSGIATTSSGAPAAHFNVSLHGGPATMSYTGARAGFTIATVASTRVAQNGSFSLSLVPAGSYVLAVSNGGTREGQPFEIAETPLEVKDESVTGITVVTARGATVSGQLEWAGKGPVPWPSNAATFGRIRATAVGRVSDFASLDSEVQADGSFRFTNLYGLRRVVSLGLPITWAIKSVEGPKDLFDGPNLSIKTGRDVTGLKVVVTNRTGMLWATVIDENNMPFDSGSVLLMPRDATDLDALGWGFRGIQKNYGNNGVWYYTMDALLPGSYLAVAIDVEPYRLTGDTELMERARRAAIPVEVNEGNTTVSLRLTRLRPFVQGMVVTTTETLSIIFGIATRFAHANSTS